MIINIIKLVIKDKSEVKNLPDKVILRRVCLTKELTAGNFDD